MSLLLTALAGAWAAMGRDVTLRATGRPAEEVFALLMKQAGCNFSYDTSLLRGRRVTVDVDGAPLEDALKQMFEGTSIGWVVKGNTVVLKRRKVAPEPRQAVVDGYVTERSTGEPLIGALVRIEGAAASSNSTGHYSLHVKRGRRVVTASYPGFIAVTDTIEIGGNMKVDFKLDELSEGSRQLGEVTVEADRRNYIAMHSADIGRLNLTRSDILSTPAMFGESDVIKTLQMQPGVMSGVEGLASMYVHGGSNDENLYMLDNVPLYQVNHFGGLFSAFNTEAIKNVDFYKSSFPVRYNGRLSSIMAVNTRDGDASGHHGQFRLGLTSGALSISGPLLGRSTTYSLAVRRSWFEAISVPALAIYNSTRTDDNNTTIGRYSFMDINAKINHNFNERSRLHLMFYYGDDYLKYGDNHSYYSPSGIPRENRSSDISRLRWGNTVVSSGWRMQWSPLLWSEVTASYSHYSSMLRNDRRERLIYDEEMFDSERSRRYRFDNRISDWGLRADFGLSAAAGHELTFGASYTIHHFEPGSERTVLADADSLVADRSITRRVNATEGSAYAGYRLDLSEGLRIEAGLNGGWFSSGSHTRGHLDPRVAARLKIDDLTSVKLSYTRSSQYVVQLAQSSLALPTDQWIPVSGGLKPRKADKISAGVYRRLPKGFIVSAEIYYKWMHNLVEYRDDYYVLPPTVDLATQLCTGSGRARGLDLMLTRSFGRVTGHVAYSLMWSDRLFKDKNHGERFPSKFDNRHKINIMLSWKINDKWDIGAAWTGMSGNRFTVSLQDYELLDVPGLPSTGTPNFSGTLDAVTGINNYRLPFYHRLDLSANRLTAHGKWSFSLYNAYCNMNVVAIKKIHPDNIYQPYGRGSASGSPSSGWYGQSLYQKFRLIPIIPSVSYTWIF